MISTHLCRQWHKYLGLTLGLVLLFIALSGTILVFKEQLIALNFTQQIKPINSTYSIDSLAKDLTAIEKKHTADNIFYIKTPTQGRDYWWVVDTEEQIYLYSPNTLAPIIDRYYVLPIIHWLQHFHTEFLISKWGTMLNALLSIGVLVLIIAGFMSWWPGRKGFRWVYLKQLPKNRGSALRTHRALGVVTLPLLLLSLITGGGMSLQGVIGYFLKAESTPPKKAPIENGLLPSSSITDLLRLVQGQFPDGQITMVQLPKQSKPEARFRVRLKDEWHINGKSSVTINPQQKQLQVKRVTENSNARKVLNLFYPLHSSYGLNNWVKSLVVLTGLLTLWLTLCFT